MLIAPILNKTKQGQSNVYNLKVKHKNAAKVKEGIVLKGYTQADIIINSQTFNSSIYNTKDKEPNSTVNFIRNANYRAEKKDFLITTKESPDSTLYDLYNVSVPPRKISAGLDNLYGSVILDMKNEIPGIEKGRYISLKKLGVDKHITEEKLEKLKAIVEEEKDPARRETLMQLQGVSDLAKTVEYLHNFEFTIVEGATIREEELKNFLELFGNLQTRDAKNLSRYYEIAKENQAVYRKLTQINKILYNKPINLITRDKKSKVLVKTKDEIKNAA